MYYSILMREMNKWLKQASDESIGEMFETLVDELYQRDKNDELSIVALISVFTDAMEEWAWD